VAGGAAQRRRARPRTAGWRQHEVADEVLAEVARQAASRRRARDEARRHLGGRMRISRPKPPSWYLAWRELRRPARVVSLLLPSLVVAGLLALNLPFLRVQRVEVQGSPVVGRAQLLAEAGVVMGQSTLQVNTGRLTESLLSQPWVQTASAAVRWPGTLVLTVTPLPPVLIFEQGKREYLLAASGAVLGPVPSGPASFPLPILQDLQGGSRPRAGQVALSSRLTSALAQLSSAFPAAYGVSVSRYLISAVGALEIQSSAGWTADLGPVLTASQVSALGPKLEALRALATKVNLKGPGIHTIFLEDPSQVVVSP
jgi:cell division septal protein FtsQ